MMNTLEIDTILRRHPRTTSVFRGVYARNRLPRILNVPTALVGNTDPDNLEGKHWIVIYIDANSKGEYYDPTGSPPFQDAYVNFMNKHCRSWTYNTIGVQEEGTDVCGHHCIFYLLHRIAGHSMTDVTKILADPVDHRHCTELYFTCETCFVKQKKRMPKKKWGRC